MAGSWHNLGSVDDFAGIEVKGALIAGVKLCVGKSGEDYFAVDDTCPHAGGSLSEGMVVASGLGAKDVHLLAVDEGAVPGQRVH